MFYVVLDHYRPVKWLEADGLAIWLDGAVSSSTLAAARIYAHIGRAIQRVK